VLATCLISASCTGATADVITDWNDVFIETIRETATSFGVNAGPGPIARAGAMLYASMYDSVNSVDDTHQAYLTNLNVPATTSREAAAATAAHRVLSHIYTGGAQQTRFNSQLATDLSVIADGAAKTDGIALGIAVADAMIATRAGDGSGILVPYTLNPAAGNWRPAPGQQAVTPGWGNLTPFTMTSSTQFRPERPAGFSTMADLLASPEYAAQVDEVRRLGGLVSAERTADQTEVAAFWANDNPGTMKPPGHLNLLNSVISQQQGLSLSENARLFALTNLAMADASIAAWDSKYNTDIDLWRPRDAIREVVNDNNPLTTPDPTWQPLAIAINGSPAPAFPAYISGHSTFAGAQAAVLTDFFGTDNIAFDLTSEDDAPGVTRHYDSFSEAAWENAISRLYLGVHYRFDSEVGIDTGYDLGHYIFDNYLQPLHVEVPEPSSIVMAVIGLVSLLVLGGRRVARRARMFA
jgi:hypothetical protein